VWPPPPAPGPGQPSSHRRRNLLIVAAAAVVLVGGGAGAYFGLASGGGPTAPAAHNATVVFTLYDSATAAQGCDASVSDDGYSDVATGMPIVVHDQRGVIVGSTALNSTADSSSGDCVWTMKLGKVPVRPQYSVNLGSRGAVAFGKSELASNGWEFDLKLGTEGD
jgi:hypothetical protein